ncbi:MAG TPA: YaiI/YqxD family protein [Thermomicrobiales bacterium]|nr:YaiI/YqxD family protein [Thermomicrobiales bacterium]
MYAFGMMSEQANQHPIYLDADACPVKDVVYKVAARYSVPLKVVANGYLRIPDIAGLDAEMVTVPGSPDAADDWIAERAVQGDLVLTADIPLAAKVVDNGVRCLDFRGTEFTSSRVVDALASRDLNAYLRSIGETTGGPKAFSPKDRSKFASTLDAAVGKMARDTKHKTYGPRDNS